MDDSIIEAKDEFIASVSSAGLSKPSDYIYIASVNGGGGGGGAKVEDP